MKFPLIWLVVMVGTLGDADPVLVLRKFEHASAAIRAQAASTYGDGCRDRKARRKFRKDVLAPPAFRKALVDDSPLVRRAAINMALCFGPENSIPILSPTLDDTDAKTSLAAMTQLAHFEHGAGVAPLAQWFETRGPTCLEAMSDFQERCVFGAYALGQSAQHEGPASKLRRKAIVALKPLLSSQHPTTREVSAVAVSLVGSKQDAPLLAKLLQFEIGHKFTNANPPEVIEHFKALITRLNIGQSK